MKRFSFVALLVVFAGVAQAEDSVLEPVVEMAPRAPSAWDGTWEVGLGTGISAIRYNPWDDSESDSVAGLRLDLIGGYRWQYLGVYLEQSMSMTICDGQWDGECGHGTTFYTTSALVKVFTPKLDLSWFHLGAFSGAGLGVIYYDRVFPYFKFGVGAELGFGDHFTWSLGFDMAFDTSSSKGFSDNGGDNIGLNNAKTPFMQFSFKF